MIGPSDTGRPMSLAELFKSIADGADHDKRILLLLPTADHGRISRSKTWFRVV